MQAQPAIVVTNPTRFGMCCMLITLVKLLIFALFLTVGIAAVMFASGMFTIDKNCSGEQVRQVQRNPHPWFCLGGLVCSGELHATLTTHRTCQEYYMFGSRPYGEPTVDTISISGPIEFVLAQIRSQETSTGGSDHQLLLPSS